LFESISQSTETNYPARKESNTSCSDNSDASREYRTKKYCKQGIKNMGIKKIVSETMDMVINLEQLNIVEWQKGQTLRELS